MTQLGRPRRRCSGWSRGAGAARGSWPMLLLRSWWVRFGIGAILAGALLLPRLPLTRGLVWSVVLSAVAATGAGMIRLSGRERADMKLVRQCDEEPVLRDGARIAVCGVI